MTRGLAISFAALTLLFSIPDRGRRGRGWARPDVRRICWNDMQPGPVLPETARHVLLRRWLGHL